jgi:hypothetical protein
VNTTYTEALALPETRQACKEKRKGNSPRKENEWIEFCKTQYYQVYKPQGVSYFEVVKLLSGDKWRGIKAAQAEAEKQHKALVAPVLTELPLHLRRLEVYTQLSELSSAMDRERLRRAAELLPPGESPPALLERGRELTAQARQVVGGPPPPRPPEPSQAPAPAPEPESAAPQVPTAELVTSATAVYARTSGRTEESITQCALTSWRRSVHSRPGTGLPATATSQSTRPRLSTGYNTPTPQKY